MQQSAVIQCNWTFVYTERLSAAGSLQGRIRRGVRWGRSIPLAAGYEETASHNRLHLPSPRPPAAHYTCQILGTIGKSFTEFDMLA